MVLGGALRRKGPFSALPSDFQERSLRWRLGLCFLVEQAHQSSVNLLLFVCVGTRGGGGVKRKRLLSSGDSSLAFLS